jgi:hypothetical protein
MLTYKTAINEASLLYYLRTYANTPSVSKYKMF